MSRFKKILGFTIAMVVGGCAATVGPQLAGTGDSIQIEDDTSSSQRSAEAELMYHILVGELAGKRGRYEVALEQYQQAIRTSNDPRVAERMVAISLYVKDYAALMDAAQRWYHLEPNNIRARQALALALLDNNQIDKAVEHLEAVREAAERDGQHGFATIATLLGQFEDSEVVFQVLDRLRELHPLSRFALYYHALAALNADDHQTALESLDAALALDPQWAPAHMLRAQAMIEADSTELALEQLAEAVAASPEDHALRTGYARLLVNNERLEEARQQFQILARQNPKDVGPLFALGLLAAERREFDKAVDYFMEVVQRGEQVMDAYYELGKVEELRGNYQQAKEWYTRVQGGEHQLNAQIRLGKILARQDNFAAMTEHFSKLRQDYQQNEIVLYLAQADILREEERHQAAFDLLTGALKEHPNDKDLLYARALAAEKVGRLDVLEKDLRTLIEIDPDNAHALNALGYTLADRTDRYQEALDYLQRAIALLPESAAVLDSMGWVHYHLGNYQQSLEYLRQAYELSADAEIAAHLSEVLWVNGHQDEARRIWREALEEDPDSPHLLKVRERLGL